MKFVLFIVLFVFVILLSLVFYAKSSAIAIFERHDSLIMTFSHIGRSFDVTGNKIKVITWNIGYASGKANNQGAVLTPDVVQKNLEDIATELNRFDPDLVFLQEVDFSAKRSHFINQFEFLAEKLNMPFVASAVLWNKKYVPYPYWPPTKHFGFTVSGQAVLSRLPIKANHVSKFAKPPQPFWYNWFYLDRVVQALTVMWGDQPIALWNVHHEAFHAQTRLTQAKILADDVLNNQVSHKIIAGDFNDPTTEAGLTLTDEKYANTFDAFLKTTHLTEAHDTSVSNATFPADNPKDTLDHIVTNSHFILKNQKVVCTTASDHCLIFAEYTKL